MPTSDERLNVRLVLDTEPRTGQDTWIATADKDNSPDYDATGQTPLAAMTRLAEVLYQELQA